MVYGLLVEPSIVLKDRGYNKLLKRREYPRSGLLSITLTITNNGQSDFPGGTVTDVILDHTSGTYRTWRTLNFQIPLLNPKQKCIVPASWFRLEVEGLFWLKSTIKAIDGQEIQFYQIGSGEPANVWMSPLVVVNRENLNIVRLLKEINIKLEELKGKA